MSERTLSERTLSERTLPERTRRAPGPLSCGLLSAGLIALTACVPVEPEDVRGTAPVDPEGDWERDTGPFDIPTGCALGPADPGTFAGGVDLELLTTTPYDFDAGVAALVDAAPSDGQSTDVQLRIEGAIVTHVGFPEDQNIWIADGGGAMRSYRAPLGANPVAGDVVSFEVTELNNYRGELQIIDVENFQIIGSGEPVYFVDATAQEINVDDHARLNVRAWAEIKGEPTDCASNCFEVDLGRQTETLRISSSRSFDDGDCLELFMPVGIFDDEVQLNVENYDWYREY